MLRKLLIAIVFLLCFEALARHFGPDPTEQDDPYLGLPGTPALYREVDPGEGRAYHERSPNKASHYRDARFLSEKHLQEYRVFCIGGSSVRSDAFTDPDGSFPNMLRLYLEGALRGEDPASTRRPNVINAGGGGMGSIQNLEVLREVLDYGPDLLVVYPEGGEKNFIGDGPRATLAKKDDESPARAACRRVFARSHLYLWVRDHYRALLKPATGPAIPSAFSAVLLAMIAKPFQPDSFSRIFEMKDDRVPPLMERPISEEEVTQAHARFQRNLLEMAHLAQKHDVPILFMLPVRNLKQSFYLRFHMTPQEIVDGKIEAWKAFYQAGCDAKKAGRYEPALAAFERVRGMYKVDRDEILAFYMAQCWEALGEQEKALAEYARPYLNHPMLAQIRGVAEEAGVPVIDPYPSLLRAASPNLPGYEWFTDAFHPMPNTNRVLARAVLAAMREHGIGAPLQPDASPAMREANEGVQRLIDSCRPPVANLMLRAIEAGDYDRAVRLAQGIGDEVLLKLRVIEPLYYGWALTRQGKLDDARTLFAKLRDIWWRPGLRDLPKLETDHEIVRIAFEGDLFHIF